ncbi:MAG: spore maturation protein A [Oscillospiraceae bacterium]|nr:spore maturation protein A [Oscillospiraceae bacterium]
MNSLLCFIAVISFVFSIFLGNSQALSDAAISGAGDAVQLTLRLAGGLCFWSGIMRLAEKAGICDLLSRLLSPILRLVFPHLDIKGKAARLISMNMSANLLGLGNAATPFGIAAMRELHMLNHQSSRPSDHMVSFAVINSASIQLLPTTLAVLRSSYGCADPMNILPATVCCSALSLAVGLLFARIIPLFKRRAKK